MKIDRKKISESKKLDKKDKIFAAEIDEEPVFDFGNDDFGGDLDDRPSFGDGDGYMLDTSEEDSEEDVEEIEEEDIEEDDVGIENDNNISNHYIAECDICNGIFVSAITESDQQVESINGICPLCQKKSEQFLRWVIKEVEF